MPFDMDLFVASFVTFFVVIDPLGVAPIFAGLTQGMSAGFQRSMAVKGVLVAAGILVFFALAGEWLLARLGISLPAFSTAGGLLLLLIGIEMIMEQRTPRRTQSARKLSGEETAEHPGSHDVSSSDIQHHDHYSADISIFPLAIPLLAGPGAIASAMLLISAGDSGVTSIVSVLGAAGAVLLLTLAMLVGAGALVERAGSSLSVLLTRIMGILLAALSVQFIFDGVKEGLLS